MNRNEMRISLFYSESEDIMFAEKMTFISTPRLFRPIPIILLCIIFILFYGTHSVFYSSASRNSRIFSKSNFNEKINTQEKGWNGVVGMHTFNLP